MNTSRAGTPIFQVAVEGFTNGQITTPTDAGINDNSKLRDKIAMQQLGVLTPIYWESCEDYASGEELIKCQCETAYEYADQMLKQRLIKGE